MIVDGLGHVSLDSGPPLANAGGGLAAQANIHQGSIPATGRKDPTSRTGTATATNGAVPASAATSLQFNQLIGGAISPNLFTSNGLAAAMQGEITVSNGVVEQSNFHNYDAIRMRQAPEIEVQILENGDKIRGIGEPGTPPAAPALTNAIFALTGQRIRELPLNKHIDFA